MPTKRLRDASSDVTVLQITNRLSAASSRLVTCIYNVDGTTTLHYL